MEFCVLYSQLPLYKQKSTSTHPTSPSVVASSTCNSAIEVLSAPPISSTHTYRHLRDPPVLQHNPHHLPTQTLRQVPTTSVVHRLSSRPTPTALAVFENLAWTSYRHSSPHPISFLLPLSAHCALMTITPSSPTPYQVCGTQAVTISTHLHLSTIGQLEYIDAYRIKPLTDKTPLTQPNPTQAPAPLPFTGSSLLLFKHHQLLTFKPGQQINPSLINPPPPPGPHPHY